MTPSSIKVIAKDYMEGLGRKVSQKSSLKEWFRGFIMRWQDELKLTKDVKLEKQRSAACTKVVIGK